MSASYENKNGDDLMELSEVMGMYFLDSNKSLKKQIGFLLSLINNMNELFYTYDLLGKINYVNQKGWEYLGYTQEEIINRYLWDFIPERNREAFINTVKQRLISGEAGSFELTMLHKDGSEKIFKLNASPIFDEGKRVGEMVLAEDISDRKNAEKRLLLSNEILKSTKEELLVSNQYLLAHEEELRYQLDEILKNKEALTEAQRQLFDIIEFLPDATFIIDKNGIVKMWNKAMEELTGIKGKDIIGKGEKIYSIPFFAEKKTMLIDLVLKPQQERKKYSDISEKDKGVLIISENFCPEIGENGTYMSGAASPLYDNYGNIIGAIQSIRDISERKEAEKILRESELKYRNILHSLEDGYFECNLSGDITFLNRALHENAGYNYDEMLGINYTKLMDAKNSKQVMSVFKKVLSFKKIQRGFNWTVSKKNGEKMYVETTVLPIVEEEKIVGFRGIIQDITERKIAENRLKFLSIHDALTGVYNRFYFEEEMKRLENGRQNPLALICCDLDGLKLVNDILGHDKGDQLLNIAAKIISQAFRAEDVVARVGGDEFAVILPNVQVEQVHTFLERIKKGLKEYNQQHPELLLSISIGFAISKNKQNIKDLYREADNNMYREKLLNGLNARNSIIKALIKTLGARDFIDEGHGERVQNLVESIAEKLILPMRTIEELRLLAHFHDIGNVSISDEILFKKGKLNEAEYEEVKRHCEIGHRIARSAPELMLISDWILKHHEWWNGEGYPLGLEGEEIPIECRIFAIADAYDSMTSDRPYRRAMSHETAIQELIIASGKQFDPYLIDKFINDKDIQGKLLSITL